ncbi:hypothetical protein [Bacteroides heparinolyticus]|uniref:hypothetical protein n=1 Tax=Prevotella heparinolytica TaxID=28113 RepID=UPI0035A13244
MKKIRFKRRSGGSHIGVLIVLVAVFVLFGFAAQVIYAIKAVNDVKERSEAIASAVVTNNYYAAYYGMREGYTASYRRSESGISSDQTVIPLALEIERRLNDELAAQPYKVEKTRLNVNVQLNKGSLNLSVVLNYTLLLPLGGANNRLYIRVPIEVKGSYNQNF